jgi:hypothetical protein
MVMKLLVLYMLNIRLTSVRHAAAHGALKFLIDKISFFDYYHNNNIIIWLSRNLMLQIITDCQVMYSTQS